MYHNLPQVPAEPYPDTLYNSRKTVHIDGQDISHLIKQSPDIALYKEGHPSLQPLYDLGQLATLPFSALLRAEDSSNEDWTTLFHHMEFHDFPQYAGKIDPLDVSKQLMARYHPSDAVRMARSIILREQVQIRHAETQARPSFDRRPRFPPNDRRQLQSNQRPYSRPPRNYSDGQGPTRNQPAGQGVPMEQMERKYHFVKIAPGTTAAIAPGTTAAIAPSTTAAINHQLVHMFVIILMVFISPLMPIRAMTTNSRLNDIYFRHLGQIAPLHTHYRTNITVDFQTITKYYDQLTQELDIAIADNTNQTLFLTDLQRQLGHQHPNTETSHHDLTIQTTVTTFTHCHNLCTNRSLFLPTIMELQQQASDKSGYMWCDIQRNSKTAHIYRKHYATDQFLKWQADLFHIFSKADLTLASGTANLLQQTSHYTPISAQFNSSANKLRFVTETVNGHCACAAQKMNYDHLRSAEHSIHSTILLHDAYSSTLQSLQLQLTSLGEQTAYLTHRLHQDSKLRRYRRNILGQAQDTLFNAFGVATSSQVHTAQQNTLHNQQQQRIIDTYLQSESRQTSKYRTHTKQLVDNLLNDIQTITADELTTHIATLASESRLSFLELTAAVEIHISLLSDYLETVQQLLHNQLPMTVLQQVGRVPPHTIHHQQTTNDDKNFTLTFDFSTVIDTYSLLEHIPLSYALQSNQSLSYNMQAYRLLVDNRAASPILATLLTTAISGQPPLYTTTSVITPHETPTTCLECLYHRLDMDTIDPLVSQYCTAFLTITGTNNIMQLITSIPNIVIVFNSNPLSIQMTCGGTKQDHLNGSPGIHYIPIANECSLSLNNTEIKMIRTKSIPVSTVTLHSFPISDQLHHHDIFQDNTTQSRLHLQHIITSQYAHYNRETQGSDPSELLKQFLLDPTNQAIVSTSGVLFTILLVTALVCCCCRDSASHCCGVVIRCTTKTIRLCKGCNWTQMYEHNSPPTTATPHLQPTPPPREIHTLTTNNSENTNHQLSRGMETLSRGLDTLAYDIDTLIKGLAFKITTVNDDTFSAEFLCRHNHRTAFTYSFANGITHTDAQCRYPPCTAVTHALVTYHLQPEKIREAIVRFRQTLTPEERNRFITPVLARLRAPTEQRRRSSPSSTEEIYLPLEHEISSLPRPEKSLPPLPDISSLPTLKYRLPIHPEAHKMKFNILHYDKITRELTIQHPCKHHVDKQLNLFKYTFDHGFQEQNTNICIHPDCPAGKLIGSLLTPKMLLELARKSQEIQATWAKTLIQDIQSILF